MNSASLECLAICRCASGNTVVHVPSGDCLPLCHRIPHSSSKPCDKYINSEDGSSDGSNGSASSSDDDDSDDDDSPRNRSPHDNSSSEYSPRYSDDSDDDNGDDNNPSSRAAKGKTGGSGKQASSKDKREANERAGPSPVQAGSTALPASTQPEDAAVQLEFQLEAAKMDTASAPADHVTLSDLFTLPDNVSAGAAAAPPARELAPGQGTRNTSQRAAPAAAPADMNDEPLSSFPLGVDSSWTAATASAAAPDTAAADVGDGAAPETTVPNFTPYETNSTLGMFDNLAQGFLDADQDTKNGSRVPDKSLPSDNITASRLSSIAIQPAQDVTETGLPDLILPLVSNSSPPGLPADQSTQAQASPEAKPSFMPQQAEALPVFMLPGREGALAAFAPSSERVADVGARADPGGQVQEQGAGPLPVWKLAAIGCAAVAAVALIALGAYAYLRRSSSGEEQADALAGEHDDEDDLSVSMSAPLGDEFSHSMRSEISGSIGAISRRSSSSAANEAPMGVAPGGPVAGNTLLGDDHVATAASPEAVQLSFSQNGRDVSSLLG